MSRAYDSVFKRTARHDDDPKGSRDLVVVPDIHMLRFVKRLFSGLEVRRLRLKESRDESPRTTIRLCRLLESLGKHAAAVGAARRGLGRFPHAHELEDVLRRCFEKRADSLSMDRVAQERSGPENLREVVRSYLEFAKPDEAVRAARSLVARYPDDAAAFVLHGRVLQALFQRDHVAKDGKAALESFKRATDLDPTSLEARRGLAAAYHAIGATSQALFHVLLALEIDPRDPESKRISTQLGRLPFQRRAEKDLLWEAEINDQTILEKKVRPADRGYDQLLKDGVQGLAAMPGAKRVAVRHHGVAIVAWAGEPARPSSAGSDAFLASAEHLRKASSAWAKRSGMGGFEESTLVLGDAVVFAVAAGGSVLAIEGDSEDRLRPIADEARNLLASWTSSRYRDLEWVR